MPRTNENTKPTTCVTRQTTKSAAKPAVAKPAVAKPATAKPAIAKPAVAKPAIAKPTIAKPAIAKPAIAKPAVAKPAIAKPAIAKPAIAKPVAKPAAKPAAKPVANKPIAKPATKQHGTKNHPLQEISTNRKANGASSDSESDSDSDSDSESMSESEGHESRSLHVAKRLAVMEKKMATKDAQLARLRKKMGIVKAAKKQKKSLIPRPKPLGNLQTAMRLAGGSSERREYLNTRQQVFTTLIGLGVNVETDTFRSFSHFQLAKFISVLKDEMPIFSRYEDVWPIPDLIQSVLKNKRHHKSRVRRAEEAANPSANDSITNQSHEDDSTTPPPTAPATPGNNAQDDDLTLPARAYFSSLSPFSATTNFQWHELENDADKFGRDAQANSDDDADDDGDRVFGGRNTSSYIRRSRFNHAENEDEDSEDGDDTVGNRGGSEDEDAEMGDDLDVEHEEDDDMENGEGEGGEDEEGGEEEEDDEDDEEEDGEDDEEEDGEEGEEEDGEDDEEEDGEDDEEEDDEDDEEVTVGIKRRAHSAIMDARNKKKFKV
ncbi:hypothetical protein BJ165DRAFT_1534266 [Panaeolus papilionaceus]|nr:hypothetical protein BJ165DRAFT_1534266 [Panaeolus papilionaceus]